MVIGVILHGYNIKKLRSVICWQCISLLHSVSLKMELIKTARGYKIAYKGHMYTLQKICLTFIRWRCSKFSSLKCPCILKTCLNIDNPTFLTLNNDHVHEGNYNLIGAAKVKRLMIEKAKSSYATSIQIYSEIVDFDNLDNCTLLMYSQN